MRIRFRLVLLQLFLIGNIFGQNWFSEDAYWIHDCCSDLFRPGYVEITFQKDTIINNTSAKYLLSELHARNLITNEIEISDFESMMVHEDSSIVYLLTEYGFDTLFNFTAVPNSSWEMFANEVFGVMVSTVIDTGRIEIENIELKWIEVEFRFDSSIFEYQVVFRDTILERIGSLKRYFLPWHSLYLGGGAGTLRCYYDNQIGFFKNSTYQYEECDYLYSSVSRVEELERKIKIFPNPAKKKITIEYEVEELNDQMVIEIYNLQGKIKYQKELRKHQIFDISREPSGVLILIIKEEGKLVYRSKVLKI